MQQRKLKNYLLDKHFQMKYTLVLLFFTLVLYAVIGYFYYYESSKSNKIIKNLSKVVPMFKHDPDYAALVTEFQSKDMKLKLLILFLTAFAVSTLLFFTGVMITHRVAGPIHVFSMYVKELTAGKWHKIRKLRRSDEFQYFQEELNALQVYLMDKEKMEIESMRELLAEVENSKIKLKSLNNFKSILKKKRDIVRM